MGSYAQFQAGLISDERGYINEDILWHLEIGVYSIENILGTI